MGAWTLSQTLLAVFAILLAFGLGFFVRERLSAHEYPRQVAFVGELPKTPAGKVHRKILRERELAALAAAADAAPY